MSVQGFEGFGCGLLKDINEHIAAPIPSLHGEGPHLGSGIGNLAVIAAEIPGCAFESSQCLGPKFIRLGNGRGGPNNQCGNAYS